MPHNMIIQKLIILQSDQLPFSEFFDRFITTHNEKSASVDLQYVPLNAHCAHKHQPINTKLSKTFCFGLKFLLLKLWKFSIEIVEIINQKVCCVTFGTPCSSITNNFMRTENNRISLKLT